MPDNETILAKALGWYWSRAHDGYINENHRNGTEWAGYVVAADIEEALFLSGIETDEDMRKAMERIE